MRGSCGKRDGIGGLTPEQLVHTSMCLCAQVVDTSFCAISHVTGFQKRRPKSLDIAPSSPFSPQERWSPVSSSEPVHPHRPHHLPARARRALPALPLLCALTLSACGMSGTTSSEAVSAPSAQETPSSPHSAAASPSGGRQRPSAAQTQTAPGSPSPSTQATDGPSPAPADTAPDRSTLLNASLPLPSTCTASGPVSFSGGQASLNLGGFARIEDPSATYVLNGTPTTVVALSCNGGGSAVFPSLAF